MVTIPSYVKGGWFPSKSALLKEGWLLGEQCAKKREEPAGGGF